MNNQVVLQLDPGPNNRRNSEATFVTLKSGRILLYWSKFISDDHSDFGAGVIGMPGYGAWQWQSFSKDGGQVWSPPTRSVFRSPCSPLQMKRIPKTGHLLAVWNDHSEHFKVPKPKPISWARTPLVSAISKDEGKTWKHFLLIESAPDHGFCYPAIHFTDEAVLLAYNAGGKTTRNPLDRQRVRRMTYDALYA